MKPKKCRFKYCGLYHDSADIVDEDGIKVSNYYYHSDCYRKKETVEQIKMMFHEKINPNAPFNILTKTVNDICFVKGNDPEFVLFGLQYYIDHKIPLNYPAGLYYVINNKDVISAWNELERKKKIEEIKKIDFSTKEDPIDFSIIPQRHSYKKKTIGDIFNE